MGELDVGEVAQMGAEAPKESIKDSGDHKDHSREMLMGEDDGHVKK